MSGPYEHFVYFKLVSYVDKVLLFQGLSEINIIIIEGVEQRTNILLFRVTGARRNDIIDLLLDEIKKIGDDKTENGLKK